MEAWIQGLVLAALGPIRQLAQAATDRISGVYNAFTGALGRIRGAAGHWVTVGRTWATAQVSHALAVATRLRWLAVVALPQAVARAVDTASRWAAEQIRAVIDQAVSLVSQLRTWAIARLTDVAAVLTAVRDYFLGKVAELRADTNRLFDRVFGPLGTPERLARWILAPLIGLLVGWAMDNIETLAVLAFRRRQVLERQTLTIVERIIDGIL